MIRFIEDNIKGEKQKSKVEQQKRRNMRIRSVKYNSKNKNSTSHVQLPQRGFLLSNIQSMSTSNLMSRSLGPNGGIKGLLTQQSFYQHGYSKLQSQKLKEIKYSKIRDTGLRQSYECQKQNIKDGSQLQKSKSSTFKSKQKVVRVEKLDIQHRNKWFEESRIEQKGDEKLIKKRQDLHRICTIKKENKKQDDEDPIKEQKQALGSQESEIILGENMNFRITQLQEQICEIQQTTSEEKSKIDIIKEQMSVLGSIIGGELNDIQTEFMNRLRSLNMMLTTEKSQKCTEIINWKLLIKAKHQQYSNQSQQIQNLSKKLDRIQYLISADEPNLQFSTKDSQHHQF